ncbi:MAG: folate family ECF transporter S component [Faecalibacterium sp.]|nr:folate family ECF transporter S component [Faecalibacterium sp.]
MRNRQKAVSSLVLSALLCALSIVLARWATINLGFVHIGFGNLPVVLAGVLLGPGLGFMVGGVADLIGGVLAGYAINPLITLGAALIGGVAGLCWHKLPLKNQTLRLIAALLPAHLVGSTIVNSLALHIFYAYPLAALALRIPNMVGQVVVEVLALRALLANASFRKAAGL